MRILVVHVTYLGKNTPLEINPPNLTLEGADCVEWIFHDLPIDSVPFVFFPDNNPEFPAQPFGPFHYLEPIVNLEFAKVVGLGNIGANAEFPYTAMVLHPDDEVTRSITDPSPRILNLSASENTSPDVLIRYTQDPPVEEEHFLVLPHTLTLERERTAIWYIEHIPRDHFITFHFEGFPAHPLRGPFLSFSLSRGFGNSWLARGAGFWSAALFLGPPPAQIFYHVRLRNAQGEIVHWDDPVIEPLGTPPGQ